MITPHGGHCGFVAEANGYDGYWAEHTAIEFLVNHAVATGTFSGQPDPLP